MIFLRSLLFNIAFWLNILLLGAGLPLAVCYRPFTFVIAKIWAKNSLFLLKTLCNITYKVEGREHIPATPCLFASKHQSAWDTIIFWELLPCPAFVLKRELIFFPIFGWYLILLKNIYIDRKSGASALKKMLKEAKTIIASDRQIVLFPEGTRTLPNAKSHLYQPGIAALYQNLDTTVIPVALNSGLLWRKNAFIKQPGVITIAFLPPLAPGLKSRDFLNHLQTAIETKQQHLSR